MTARCTFCGKPFDSHDGGRLCMSCGKAACPECEKRQFTDEDDGPHISNEVEKCMVCIGCKEKLSGAN